MYIPKFVKVIVDDAHDTTKGRIYAVDREASKECLIEGAVWIKQDDVGDEYYLYNGEYEEVTND